MKRNAAAIALLGVGLGACGSEATGVEAGTGSASSAGGDGRSSGGAVNSGGTAGVGGELGSGGLTGGVTASGGTTHVGGATESGGLTSSGGVTASGGTTHVGGATESGGLTSSGGVTTTGGIGGSGGLTNFGGVAGGPIATGGAPPGGGTGVTGGAAGSGGASGSAGQGPQTCPPSPSPLAAGNHDASLQHDGRTRTYTLHVPPGVTGAEPVALVFDLHGAGGNGLQQRQMSGWEAVADREGFLVVYPDGVDGYWNVDDTCCGTAGSEKIDDVGLIRVMIDTLSGQTCIDSQRIYVSGFSNGGGLAHRMGCDAADVVAAVAPVATDLRTQPCNAVRAISMMEVRGMSDSLEPYEGGVVGPPGGQYISPGAQGSLQLWAEINQCTGTPTIMEEYCESYTECAGGVETDLCSLPDVDHGTYNNWMNFDVASVAWRMFQRQPMR